MPLTPGKWFVGEKELDYQEWGYDGVVWAPPLPDDPESEPCVVAKLRGGGA